MLFQKRIDRAMRYQKERNEAAELKKPTEEDKDAVRVLVGMATCGIAAGAKPVLTALVDEIARRNLSHVTVSQTGRSRS